ncbi:MAG: MBL fold metallo-hydrolase [Clostridia bacterium]|nr:MBL fold metallo-hydrolase [Clostridia bacterium]
MGYEAEKIKAEKKMNKFKRRLFLLVLLIVLTLCVIAAFVGAHTWKYYFDLPSVGARAEGELRVHFLDVGQGDCTVVELPDDKIMLIDGGNTSEESATAIMRYFKALQIEAIDYLLVTHADSDHCGGLTTILQEYTPKRAFLPVSEQTDTGAYAEFFEALVKTDCAWQYSNRSVDLSSEGEYPYTLRFLYPYTIDTEGEPISPQTDNEGSAVVWLDYRGASVLFTGDAPKTTEEKLLRDDRLGLLTNTGVALSSTEILKVAHHGSADSTSREFVEYLGVEHAVISCGEDNLYGHPSNEACAALTGARAEILRTDLHGHVIATLSATGNYNFEKLGK